VNLINQVLMFSASVLAGLSITEDSPFQIGSSWLIANLVMFFITNSVFHWTSTLRSWREGFRGMSIIAATSLGAGMLAMFWPQQGLLSMAAGAIVIVAHSAISLPLAFNSWQHIQSIAKDEAR
jgi:uncharacterized membrane protein HdeD (DUF308 family)